MRFLGKTPRERRCQRILADLSEAFEHFHDRQRHVSVIGPGAGTAREVVGRDRERRSREEQLAERVADRQPFEAAPGANEIG